MSPEMKLNRADMTTEERKSTTADMFEIRADNSASQGETLIIESLIYYQ